MKNLSIKLSEYYAYLSFWKRPCLCRVKVLLCRKLLPHRSHMNGFESKWISLWLLRSSLFLKYLSHTWHWCSQRWFEGISTISWGAQYIFSEEQVYFSLNSVWRKAISIMYFTSLVTHFDPLTSKMPTKKINKNQKKWKNEKQLFV